VIQLAAALAQKPVVLLGEVHDNAAQHELRARALERLLASGVRPALAFEQFDRESQEAIDKARIRVDSEGIDARVDRIVEKAGARGWNWRFYRPYIALALQYDLPIVAANLARAQAMRIAMDGLETGLSQGQRRALGIDRIDFAVLRAQESEIAQGHCGRAPPDAVQAMAMAQMARDATLAQAILPFATRGVVLLTGNGHARRDIGVERYLPDAVRTRTLSVGLLEDGAEAPARSLNYDLAIRTPVQAREDPCKSIPNGPMKMGQPNPQPES
jgi:uncharacterized iron-regulated protein